MAALSRIRMHLSLHQSVTLQFGAWLIPALTSTFCHSRLFSATSKSNEPKRSVNPENESLLENLNLMGVDVKMARKRQPGVFRKAITNEQGLAQFLKNKGASNEVIASIISRYPRAITRSVEHLEQRWKVLRNFFRFDEEIVSILARSPESFFRSSDNRNLEKNITFLTSLGLNTKDLHRLLTTAPRTFSNRVELNKQMVMFLEEICVELGDSNPQLFAKTVISKNVYILIRSIERVKKNIENLKAFLNLSDPELLAFLQGTGAAILDLSNEYLKKNFNNIQQQMTSLGCGKADINKLIITYPLVLYTRSNTMTTKLDCLLKGGITIKQIIEKPKVLEYSAQNIMGRLEELQKVGYDFQKNGISILDSSQKRFFAKLKKLSAVSDD
ncbi:transcription termination factor 1a, mitochondrial [Anabas testudineus]|uniref:Mitochondrial transcription termination factor 1 n=1 Tax=Anabas testudineus TaxID=64144 RepID=A0A3Q1I8F1_ANATE|nr:transcription termination factor 1a, mitochondrial [Anabas testudineus]XP_026204604.1 transcription termination factor 1a, mitochondrial [Anabas testudineus]